MNCQCHSARYCNNRFVFGRPLQVTVCPMPRDHCSVCPVGWIKMPLGTQVGLRPRDNVLDGDPAATTAQQPLPTFRLMSILAKRSPISATTELLLIPREFSALQKPSESL